MAWRPSGARFRRLPAVRILLALLCILAFGPSLFDWATSRIYEPWPVSGDRVLIPQSFLRETGDKPGLEEAVDTSSQSARHFYREDGLLEVNPDGPHPIFELVERARVRWKQKHMRASSTLLQACKEYERRYGRRPPRGFNIWWLYVKAYDVQLPDEYDRISRDMAPFWGIDPRRLQEIQRRQESAEDTYTIGKNTDDGPLEILNSAFENEERMEGLTAPFKLLTDLMDEVTPFLPKFRAILNAMDEPRLLSDHELLTEAIKAGKEGRYIDVDHPPPIKRDGWKSACAPQSPARQSQVTFASSPPAPQDVLKMKYDSPYASPPSKTHSTRRKTFIYNHTLSMDPCLHASHLLTHGQFLSNKHGPIPSQQLIPQFTFAPSALNYEIALALPYYWTTTFPVFDSDFDRKSETRLHWRGATTGMHNNPRTSPQWKYSQRMRLVDWANPRKERPWSVDSILWSPPDRRWKVGEAAGLERPEGVAKATWIHAMTDIAFARKPLQCTDKVCEEIRETYEFRLYKYAQSQGKCKYIVDVDGNGWSSRFKRLITSHSLIFKSTIYEEWFYDRMEAWVHYVPVQVDYSDLLDAHYFFGGDPLGRGAHLDLAKEIAHAGSEWSNKYLREKDATAYMFRLLLDYARVMSTERENGGLDYVYKPEDEYSIGDEDAANSGWDSSGRFLKVMERRRRREIPSVKRPT